VQISRGFLTSLGNVRAPQLRDLQRRDRRTAGDDGFSVVFVQTVEREAVVEQGRHLEEHLTSHRQIDLGTCSATASAVAAN
jgi:hypothetical protein